MTLGCLISSAGFAAHARSDKFPYVSYSKDSRLIEILVDPLLTPAFLMMTGDCGDAFAFFVGLDGVGSWDENKTKKCGTKSTERGRVNRSSLPLLSSFHLLHFITALLKLHCESSSIVSNLVRYRAFCNAKLAICTLCTLRLSQPAITDTRLLNS